MKYKQLLLRLVIVIIMSFFSYYLQGIVEEQYKYFNYNLNLFAILYKYLYMIELGIFVSCLIPVDQTQLQLYSKIQVLCRVLIVVFFGLILSTYFIRSNVKLFVAVYTTPEWMILLVALFLRKQN